MLSDGGERGGQTETGGVRVDRGGGHVSLSSLNMSRIRYPGTRSHLSLLLSLLSLTDLSLLSHCSLTALLLLFLLPSSDPRGDWLGRQPGKGRETVNVANNMRCRVFATVVVRCSVHCSIARSIRLYGSVARSYSNYVCVSHTHTYENSVS